jgi:membrane fusion protein (multidrug efflux system)
MTPFHGSHSGWVAGAAAALLLAGAGCGDSGEAHGSDSGQELAPAPEARLRVRAEPVRLGSLESADSVTGTVRAFHRATLTAETQGRVVARRALPGAQVKAGELLVELEASRFDLELRRAETALGAARTVLAHAERELERGRQLISRSAISTQRLDNLQHALDRARDELALAKVSRDSAARDLADTRILAPFSGTLDSLEVNVGDFVAPGTPVATLVDLSRVRIFGGVTAREAARLTAGSPAQVDFADLGGERFPATLKSIGRVADRADGTYEIELWLDDPPERVRDGLVARIELPDASREQHLLTRRAALLRRDGRPEVFVVEHLGDRAIARTRTLLTGRSSGDWVEVLEGLEEGDRVIYEGHFALADGTPVNLDEEPQGPAAVASP